MPLGVQLLIAFVLGVGLGALIAWLFQRGRPGRSDSRLEAELRQQVAQLTSDLTSIRADLTEAVTAKAGAEAARVAADTLLSQQKESHERSLRETKEAQSKALLDLRDTFKALSADALRQHAPEFLRLAEQTFGKLQESAKGELSQRQEAIKTLVEPLRQQLETYQRRLQQNEKDQATALGAVTKHLEELKHSSQSLADETLKFRMVLKSSQARGRWGEETLRRVVEAAGMSAHCDFTEQAQIGENRPDLIVRLPGERVIIVDSKVPELDFVGAIDTPDPQKRSEYLANHATKLKATIKALGDRDYPSQFPNALDYVVLFMPAESLFSAALEADQEIIVWAANRRILLATPASLIALLRSVAVSWQQHDQAENAREIAQDAQELFARVVTFMGHFEKIGAGLDRANKAFNDAVSSYEVRVRPAGQRVEQLGAAVTGKELPELEPVETTLRLPSG